jgi:phage terminase large subunit
MQIDFGTPNPKQEEFLLSKTRFTAYGGARGGGKSWVVRTKAKLMALRYAGIRILIMRKTFPELRENHILPLMGELMGIATYKDSDKSFTFLNGSRLRFGYCDNDADVHQYQGQEYDVIFMDEATHFTEFQFSTLTACMRGANDFPKRMYLTCNPGGVGHHWVKRLFVDRKYQGAEKPEDYCFIQAKVTDNKVLMDNDPGYVDMLNNLPDDLRRAWRDGDWDLFIGQYFNEWRREIHTCEPFEIPKDWKRYFTMDYGLDMLAAYWIAVDHQGKAYVYREVFQPNLIISEAAAAVKAAENEQIAVRFAPPDLWNRRQDTGRSVAEIFSQHGLSLTKATNDRVAGWLDMKEWLQPVVDEEGNASSNLTIFRNCTNLIESIPALQFDQKNPSDCATEPHQFTHGPDAIRYFLAGRPRPNARPAPKPVFNFKSERPKPNPSGYGENVRVM